MSIPPVDFNHGLLGNGEGGLTFWTTQTTGSLDRFSAWTERTASQFRKELTAVADAFPRIDESEDQEDERHVTLFVHGFNNSWHEAARRYQQICRTLYSGQDSLGECVLFTWPSNGRKTSYYPDRIDARHTADDLAEVLSTLYDHLLRQQQLAMREGGPLCRAKISIIAHSMGGYVLQKALAHVWTRKNQPLLVSLVNQLVMVAADVDNDLFRGGEQIDKEDGDAIANLTYRVSALYSGKDSTLGVSAGLKHFGKRRLGRSGLDRSTPLPDNVWDVDCTQFFGRRRRVHSAYFDVAKTQHIMRDLLRGVDRQVLAHKHRVRAAIGHA